MLKSGGPVMEVFATDGDSVLCEWKEYISDDSKEGGIRVIKINRMSFNKDTLYKLVKYGSVAQ